MAVILATVLVRREFKTVMQRLFIYLLFATLLREAVLMSNIEHQFEYEQMDEVCSVLGALNYYTANVVVIFVAATIIYLLSRVVRDWKRSAAFANMFELGLVLLSFLAPLIVCAAILYTDIFGLSTAWCWMRKYDSQCLRVDDLRKVFGGYSVLLITEVLSVVLTTTIMVIYYKLARQKIKQAAQLLKPALILVTCLIVNVVILVFSAIVTAIELKAAITLQ